MTRTLFNADKLSDFETCHSLEWLETNGLGGYASGTVSGAHSRRYHGLLVAATQPPVGRQVLLSKLDETLLVNNQRFELSTNCYPGAVNPTGYQHLHSFQKDLFPVWTYKIGNVTLTKTVAAIHGENTTVVIYELVDGPETVMMELLPLYALRDFHELAHANAYISSNYVFENDTFQTRNYFGGAELFIKVPGATFSEQQYWYYNFQYQVENYRGLDHSEDLYTHGKFAVALKKGVRVGVLISAQQPGGKDALQLFAGEKKRREKVTNDFTWNEDLKQLILGADQFIVSRGAKLETVIAGYHWFSDWGRDTMISLTGLTLATGRAKDAKKILLAFAESISEGMLPNRFPDHGEQPEYNTVDATLWFFLAVYKYFQYTGDKALVKKLLPALADIIHWHDKGTRYGIKTDTQDGLLSAGQEGVQLTWMDAKVGDWVVTPRRGKAVEINALWYNALCVMSCFHEEAGSAGGASMFRNRAEQVLESFENVFWDSSLGYLYDFVEGEYKNADLRPNQLYAVGLPFPLLSADKAASVVRVAEEQLLTPRGLRSLSPMHHGYKPVYGGGVWDRDGAYHQGTVWSFLLGVYIDSLLRVRGDKGRAEAARILHTFFTHLAEGCVGSVSEIFDAQSPHKPRGCMAQAWGVAEILRVVMEHDLLMKPKQLSRPQVEAV